MTHVGQDLRLRGRSGKRQPGWLGARGFAYHAGKVA